MYFSEGAHVSDTLLGTLKNKSFDGWGVRGGGGKLLQKFPSPGKAIPTDFLL